MKHSNDNSRRDFLRQAAVIGAGAVLASPSNLRIGVGKLTTPNQYGQMTTVLNRTALAGSNTGGIRETQDRLDFCALQNIRPQITRITMSGINDAWSKVVAKQARYRFVMDMAMKG
jgi:D-arabinose 1-dehydrogenase-like Zn-dependent alcohol dehydrogenase